MNISGVYHGGGAVLAALAPDHDALRQRLPSRLGLFSEQFSRCCCRHGGRLILLCLPAPFLWSERDVAVGLSYLCSVCPPSRSVLTVADGFALDVIKVIDMSNQRNTAQHRKHHGCDGD